MKSSQKMFLVFLLNITFAIIECIFGFLFNSSAVLADAVHDFGDALAIGLATLFEKISNKQHDQTYTLGYKRYSLLGALVTSIILITGSSLVLFENIPKLFAAEKVNQDGMLILGIIAIFINFLASKIVGQGHGHNHNESMLSLHFLEDILGWLAVIIVSLILRFINWYFLDPLLSLAISIFILAKTLPQFWETIQIFLNRIPKNLDFQSLFIQVQEVNNVHLLTQFNIWASDGLEKFAMIHLCLENPQKLKETKQAIHTLLNSYGIEHVTIECDDSLEEHLHHGEEVS